MKLINMILMITLIALPLQAEVAKWKDPDKSGELANTLGTLGLAFMGVAIILTIIHYSGKDKEKELESDAAAHRSTKLNRENRSILSTWRSIQNLDDEDRKWSVNWDLGAGYDTSESEAGDWKKMGIRLSRSLM
jgi:hypothetical protein